MSLANKVGVIGEYSVSFEELKAHLSSPRLLSQLREGEDLFLYLGVLDLVVSIVMVKEDKGVQRLVF